MWGRTNKLNYRISLQVFAAAFFCITTNTVYSKETFSVNIKASVFGDTTKTDLKKGSKKEKPVEEVKDIDEGGSVTIDVTPNANDSLGGGVRITTTVDDLDELVPEQPLIVKKEIVVEPDYKFMKTIVHKGRKVTVYRMLEQDYGTYYKKNNMDITEELYLQETADLPEAETIRYSREEYEAMEKKRYEDELRKQLGEVRTIPLDSTYVGTTPNTAPDTELTDFNNPGTTDPGTQGTTENGVTDINNSGTTEPGTEQNQGVDENSDNQGGGGSNEQTQPEPEMRKLEE